MRGALAEELFEREPDRLWSFSAFAHGAAATPLPSLAGAVIEQLERMVREANGSEAETRAMLASVVEQFGSVPPPAPHEANLTFPRLWRRGQEWIAILDGARANFAALAERAVEAFPEDAPAIRAVAARLDDAIARDRAQVLAALEYFRKWTLRSQAPAIVGANAESLARLAR